jgi:hypothetical protein
MIKINLAKDLYNLKHGMTKNPTYGIWKNMKSRCAENADKGNGNYKNYYRRGISVCIEWQYNYLNFHEWAIANGYQKGLQLDRINNNLGYSPKNCRFVTPMDNVNNSRKTVKFSYFGEVLSLSQAERKFKISRKVIAHRIFKLWLTPEEAVTIPVSNGGSAWTAMMRNRIT